MTARKSAPTIETAEPTAEAKPRLAPGVLSEVHLTFDQLQSIGTVFVAASVDDVTPIITCAQVTLTGNRVEAQGTDRYRIARVSFDTDEQSFGDASFLVTPALIKSAIAAGKVRGQHKELITAATIQLRLVERPQHGRFDVTIEAPLFGWHFDEMQMVGNFPPVGRLFPALDDVHSLAMGTSINMRLLADAAAVRVPGQVNPAEKNPTWTIGQAGATEDDRPGMRPVYFRQESGTSVAEYLLQPNRPLR